MLWVNHGWPVLLAIVAAIAVGALVGAIYALLLTRLGMPSFVATLAGLLAILGMQLYVLGATGSINLPYDSTLVNLGQLIIIPAAVSYLLALAPGAVMMLLGMRTRERRRASNLSAPSVGSLLVRSLAITVLLEVVVAYLNQGRGVPLMFGVFLGLAVAMDYALKRTRWGRSMNAVGGNHEAARRAGINVSAIYMSAFVLCASFAALGGVLTAARLASASQQAGSGDVNLNAIAAAVIGGTSLFGGRGSAYSAVLGIIVIQSIASGLTLLNLSSSLRFMITGAVLAIAVIVDSLARQSRVSHGRA
jgi:D-xylose transport system permease protein